MPEWGKFGVGDPVSVWGGYGRLERLAVVAKVEARKMTLDDNSEWKANGTRPYGSVSRYGGRSVQHREGDDELNLLRNAAQNALRAIVCERLEEADLRMILEIAKRGEPV